MAYAALSDLVARAGEVEILQVADRDGDGVADADAVTGALAEADQVINAYLATRYGVPLSTTPPIVKRWAVAIARYTLHRDGAPDHVSADYRQALTELKDAASGKIALPDVAGLAPAASSGGAIAEARPTTFTDEALRGWF